MQTISTPELLEELNKQDSSIIDIRPVEAYNGWRLMNEKRGGHIPGARSLPHKWIAYLDWIEIVRAKDLDPQNKIIIYGYEQEKTTEVADHFQKAGYTQIYLYNDFVEQWSSDPELPLEKLYRYQNLVSAPWLKELLDTGRADEYHNNRFVICHAHYRNPDAYMEGHIPGAVALDTNDLESPETWNRRTPQEIKETLERLGITHDTTVILYGRFSFPDNDDPFPGSSAGHLGAIRCALIMLYAGVQDIRILNGGLQAWVDAGYETTRKPTNSTPIADFGINIPAQPQLIIDTPQAKEVLKDPHSNLVSVRSWPEFIGETSGYNYIKKKGRIPGAVFGNCGSDAYHMENYRNLDHTTREAQEIENLWAEAGITKEKYNAFYCGTGWRGSEAFLNGWLMGWPKISVYDGGWFEWSNDEDNPFDTGIPH